MIINEQGNKVCLILEDGCRLNADARVVDISAEGKAEKGVRKDPYDYVMVMGFRADRDQKLIDQVAQVQLDLLRKLKQVCDSHGLKLFMMYGTLLGAVRHKGVIPGDDDIDVALFRDDYDKLMDLVDEFDGKYFLQTPDNDSGFFGGYSKLRNQETTALNGLNQWADCCEGISIDIFPIDIGFSSKIMEHIKEKRICFYQRLLYAKAYGDARNYKDMPLFVWKGYKYFGMLFSKDRLTIGLNRALKSGDRKCDSPMGIYARYTSGKKSMKFSQKVFKNEVLMQYEDLILLAPGDYKSILRSKYGEEFMKFPIPSGEPKHRHGFYDVDHPYTELKKHFDSRLKKIPGGKQIILVGDPLICYEFLKRHSDSHPVSYMVTYRTVSIDTANYEHTEFMVNSKSLDEFKKEDFESFFPFLCGFNYRKLWGLMKEIKCQDYFFFHYNSSWMLTSDPEKEAQRYLETLGCV